MFRKVFVLISLLCSYQAAFSQHNPILDNFSLFDNNEKVFLKWTITSGSTCNGIQIFRSNNNSQFTEIGSIAGVCGSSSSPTPYNFTDANPVKNSINYYRLELGSNGTSEIISIEIIDIANNGYQIRPNPVNINAKIYFDNNNKQQHHLLLYNANGIYTLTISTMDDFFILNAANLSGGIYFFTILNAANTLKAKGKILIQH